MGEHHDTKRLTGNSPCEEFLRFLREIDRATPKRLDLHLIVDNYATHKHAKVKAWLAQHPRFSSTSR